MNVAVYSFWRLVFTASVTVRPFTSPVIIEPAPQWRAT
jgi:hypothetical protein